MWRSMPPSVSRSSHVPRTTRITGEPSAFAARMPSARCSSAVPRFGLKAFEVGQTLHVPRLDLQDLRRRLLAHSPQRRIVERLEGVEVGDEERASSRATPRSPRAAAPSSPCARTAKLSRPRRWPRMRRRRRRRRRRHQRATPANAVGALQEMPAGDEALHCAQRAYLIAKVATTGAWSLVPTSAAPGRTPRVAASEASRDVVDAPADVPLAHVPPWRPPREQRSRCRGRACGRRPRGPAPSSRSIIARSSGRWPMTPVLRSFGWRSLIRVRDVQVAADDERRPGRASRAAHAASARGIRIFAGKSLPPFGT